MGRPTFAPEIGPTGSLVIIITMIEKVNHARDPRTGDYVRDPRTGERSPGERTYHCDVRCNDGSHAIGKWVDGDGWMWLEVDGRALPRRERIYGVDIVSVPYPKPDR